MIFREVGLVVRWEPFQEIRLQKSTPACRSVNRQYC